MKKIVLLSMFILLVFVGCNDTDKTAQNIENIKLPNGYSYKAINNRGVAVEGQIGIYQIKVFSNYEETVNPQSRHHSIVVTMDDKNSEEIPLQLSYIDKTVVVAVYKDAQLVGQSDIITMNEDEPLTIVNVTLND